MAALICGLHILPGISPSVNSSALRFFIYLFGLVWVWIPASYSRWRGAASCFVFKKIMNQAQPQGCVSRLPLASTPWAPSCSRLGLGLLQLGAAGSRGSSADEFSCPSGILRRHMPQNGLGKALFRLVSLQVIIASSFIFFFLTALVVLDNRRYCFSKQPLCY